MLNTNQNIQSYLILWRQWRGSASYVVLFYCLAKRVSDMERLDYVIAMLERTLATKSKRHILGGALISASLLFGGLALTVMTLKTEDIENNEMQIY